MQNKENIQRNRNQMVKKQNQKSNSSENNLFQFEMGNELGANIEEEKTMFKNEYEKDKLKRKNRENNHLTTNKNQIK